MFLHVCASAYVCHTGARANMWHARVTIHHSAVRGMTVLLGNGRSVPPWCLCLYCQAAPKCLPWIPGTEAALHCTQMYMNTRRAETVFSPMDASHNGLIAVVLYFITGK